MSDRHQVWATLASLLSRLEGDVETALAPPKIPPEFPPEFPHKLDGLEQEVRKLGKMQFKANALAEEQTARWDKAIAGMELAQAQQADLLDALVAERVAEAQQTWLESLLPVLDGLDHAIASGQQYLSKRDQAATLPNLTLAQAALLSPADRAKLASWLDGLRLIRERLLAVLEAGAVTPIPTVGHPFDPYLHVAVATTDTLPDTWEHGHPARANDEAIEAGLVLAEERRGYQSPDGVLRYADVVVYRPKRA